MVRLKKLYNFNLAIVLSKLSGFYSSQFGCAQAAVYIMNINIAMVGTERYSYTKQIAYTEPNFANISLKIRKLSKLCID